MFRADLHVHSKYSNHPSEWFLQRLGASESYTEPEFIYRSAKEKGMNFVTVTDHNRIEAALLLKERYPQDVFTGVESTAYFPEDGCKVHILIYGFDERQFEEIQTHRHNIYDLSEYLHENRLAHSVAHASFSVNGKISLAHLEKLILLFNVFEARNGGRSRFHNDTWTAILSDLTPETVNYLYRKYRIEPRGENPWIKGLTGGSDDHAGLFIGQTYTQSAARTKDEFLKSIMDRKTEAEGRHNNYKSLAFMFYKIAYEFSQKKREAAPSSFLGQLTEFIFERKGIGLKNRLLLKRAMSSSGKDGRRFYKLLADLIDEMGKHRSSPLDVRLNLAFEKIAEIADEFFKILLQSFEKDLQNGDLISLIKNISASIPGIFLSMPFFSTVKLISENRSLLAEMQAFYGAKKESRPKKILWFTDTLGDLNGVSVTLQKIGNLALEKDLPLHIVGSSGDGESIKGAAVKGINLPPIHSFRLPGYESYTIRIPSVLKSLERIYQLDPDEIIISTPGPIGMLGLLAARLLNVKSVGIYHTDYTRQALKVIPDESVAQLLESLTKAFFSAMDEIRVPTREYIQILACRGFTPVKMRVFRRGIDARIFSPQPKARERIQRKYGLAKGLNLLYVGRVSKDKDLDFLLQVHRALLEKGEEVNLMIVGDGPYLKDLQAAAKKQDRIHFAGRMGYRQLPEVYSAADLFIFPSTTDTFGMAVLEAQSCGVPALVSDQGGPQEIVEDHQTGFVVKAGSVPSWVEKVLFVRQMMQSSPWRYLRMREEARRLVLQNYSWDNMIKEIFDEKNENSFRLHPQQRQEPDGRGLSQSFGRRPV